MSHASVSRRAFIGATGTVAATATLAGVSKPVRADEAEPADAPYIPAFMTAPDSVAMLALERGEGITNDELRIGMPLAVLGIKAAEPWYRIPEGFSCWDEVFRNVGLGENVEHVAF